jgi:uncharacterized membrane protein
MLQNGILITVSSKVPSSTKLLFPISQIVFGVVGWLAAFLLTLERIRVAGNPDATLICDISPFLSCKSVMLSEQASLFGFPNPLIGLAAFAAPVFVGVALLAGASFHKWFWVLYQLGITLGMSFVIWLFIQSVYDIRSLCIYCMVAWSAMIPLFWSGTGFTMKHGVFGDRPRKLGGMLFEWNWALTLFTYLAFVIGIVLQFFDYWVVFFRQLGI